MSEKRPADRTQLIVGAVLAAIGALMCLEGWEHTLSGEPIPATSWTEESTGPETLLFGVVGLAFGAYLIRRGLQGRRWN